VRKKCLLKSVEDHHSSLYGLPRVSQLLPVPTLQGEKIEVDEKVVNVVQAKALAEMPLDHNGLHDILFIQISFPLEVQGSKGSLWRSVEVPELPREYQSDV
jgi:hypothetical protein